MMRVVGGNADDGRDEKYVEDMSLALRFVATGMRYGNQVGMM